MSLNNVENIAFLSSNSQLSYVVIYFEKKILMYFTDFAFGNKLMV